MKGERELGLGHGRNGGKDLEGMEGRTWKEWREGLGRERTWIEGTRKRTEEDSEGRKRFVRGKD